MTLSYLDDPERMDGFTEALHVMHERANTHGETSWTSRWDETGWVVTENSTGVEFRVEKKPRLKLPDVPNVLTNGRGNAPSLAPVSAVLSASYSAHEKRKEKWRGEDTVPTYAHKTKQGTTMVELRPPKSKPEEDYRLSDDTVNRMWSLITGKDADGVSVENMSPYANDVVMAMLMQYIGAPSDNLGWQWITAERILEYRGLRKKMKNGYSAGYRADELDALATCLSQLENFWVKTSEWQQGKLLYTYHSRFLVIKGTITQAELAGESDKELASPSRAVAWQFQPGDWFIAFRDGIRRKYAEVMAQCLQYDPYHELWESRLAKYLTIHLRIDASNGPTLKRKVGDMLDELSLSFDKSHPETGFQRFKKAMDRLAKDGIIAQWSYQDKAFEQNRKARGWVTDWLNQYVLITASDGTTQQYKQIAAKSETRRNRAEALKTARQAKRKEKKDA